MTDIFREGERALEDGDEFYRHTGDWQEEADHQEGRQDYEADMVDDDAE